MKNNHIKKEKRFIRVFFLFKIKYLNNKNMEIKFARIKDVKMPVRGTAESAGIDFFVPNDFETITIKNGEDVKIQSGIKCKMPKGTSLIAFNKSGVALKGLSIGACIVGETIIDTNKGLFTAVTLTKEFIKKNDILIRGYDEKNKTFNYYSFDGFRISGNKETIKLTFENGEELICSDDHLLLTENRGWIEAKDLSFDDILVTNS